MYLPKITVFPSFSQSTEASRRPRAELPQAVNPPLFVARQPQYTARDTELSTSAAGNVEKSHRRASLHKRWLHVGAADEARTRYLHLGKVALYQMSYGRILETLLSFLTGASDRNRTNDTGIFSPLLYRLSYRGVQAPACGAGPPRKLANARFCGEEEKVWRSSRRSCLQDCQMNRRTFDERPGSGSNRRPPA